MVVRPEQLDLLLAHESKDQGRNLRQHRDVGPEGEKQHIVAREPIVVPFADPVVVPRIIHAQSVKNRAERQWDRQHHVGHPEVAPELLVEVLEVVAQAL